MIAPALADPRISAPVFLPCMRLQRRRRRVERRHRPDRIGRDRREIDRLSADHADRSGRRRDGLDDPQLARDQIRIRRDAARAPGDETPRSAVHRPRGSPSLHPRRRAASACRAASCHRPSREGRRESASRCESARSRTPRASPAIDRRRRRRRWPGTGSDADACRRPSGCSASPRRRRRGSRAATAAPTPAPLRSRHDGRRDRR